MNTKKFQSKKDEHKKFNEYGEIMNRVNEKKIGGQTPLSKEGQG